MSIKGTSHTFTPKNEQGVIYLFSKYHEQLGFEKILRISNRFPDIDAMRNNQRVSIELEYKLSGLLNHSHYLARKLNVYKYRLLDPLGNVVEVELCWVYDKKIKAWRPTPIPWNYSFEEAENYINSIKMNTQNMDILVTWGGLKSDISKRVPDEKGDRFEAYERGELYFKSLKPICDIIVCWDADCDIDDPEIEIIELKTVLEEN